MAHFVYSLCIVLLTVICASGLDLNDSTRSRTELHPARDFTRHTLIKPRIYHGREKRQISTTKEKDKEHIPHLTITFDIEDEEYILDLTLNKQLISKGFSHRYQDNGIDKVHRPAPEDVELCHYNGKVRGKPNSWVALSTCDGLSGVFYDGQEMHYIEKDTKVVDSTIEVPHFLYKHSDIVDHNKTCGYGGDALDHSHDEHKYNRATRYKRSTDDNEIRGPYNSNKESKYVELVLVIDNREYKELGENRQRVENHCKTIANIINGIYAPLNIFIALVGVVIWNKHDEISFSDNGDTTLTNFLHYRREKLIKDHPNDNAQLLTKFNFNNGVVGKALKGPICTYEYSGGVNTDHSPVVGLVATTVAHELGHNFGMEHDTTECKCPDEKCIMAASSSTVAPVHWSSCSLKSLLHAFTHGMDYCLKNKPQYLFDGPVCGNGFVEHGEECDCGLPENCDNNCCDPNTCKLYSNASCGTGACCDLETCSFKTAGLVCRTADYECDLPEYCTGSSEFCPADVFKMDTEPCNDGKAYCYHGFCRTRTDQCKLLWGVTGKSSDDQCYKMNIKGTRHGNCGYNKQNQSFTKCDTEDVLCGMLHCKHLNERLEFGMESVAILSHSFINLKGSIIPCRTAIVDLGINQIDPGLTPDGAKCGTDKICVNQKCMPVESLRKACPFDCYGNGFCNSLGHCHCEVGFAPPYCEKAGHGGSEDSGPASDPDAHRVYVNVLFIIFLGVIPFIAILLFLWHYTRRNFEWMKNSPATSKSPTKSRGSMFPPEPTKRSEDNHSLLQKDSVDALQSNFFGNFKGFSLTPIKKAEPEPIRAAPAPPTAAPSAAPLTPNAASITSSFGITLKTSTLSSSPSKGLIAPAKNPAVTPVKSPIVSRSSTVNVNKNDAAKPLISKTNSFKQDRTTVVDSISVAPALPPPNPGSNARPIISSPVLENSTCTAKELISPLKNAPKVPFRPAPVIPPNKAIENEHKRPLSTPEVSIHNIGPLTDDVKKSVNSTLNRIASFLKPADKKQVPQCPNTGSTSTSVVKANKILDKNALRNMEISSPIPQTEIDIAAKALPVDSEKNKAIVMRAQSMRGTQVTKRPPIMTFGSMRQPNGKRPVSIPSGVRPKSPPPPLPPGATAESGSKDKIAGDKFKIPSLPGYQKPQGKPSVNKIDNNNQYDDCLNKTEPLSNSHEDSNIYAVIEESPLSPKTSPLGHVKSDTSSSESVGLLGEIVSEIQNRNFDSIYSTSTLSRREKENDDKAVKPVKSPDTSDLYENTCSYKSPESEYSNMSSNIKSSASSTSSGYILPSAINVPVKQNVPGKTEPVNKDVTKPTLSTFRSDKPLTSTFSKPEAPAYKTPISAAMKVTSECDSKVNSVKNKPSLSSSSKTPPSPTSKTASKTINRQTTPPNLINRQTTPPNLRSRKPSPSRPAPTAAPKTNRSVTNSPDLVTSCSNTKPTVKTPDVLNSSPSVKKPAVAATKPNMNGLPKGPQKVTGGKTISVKQTLEKKPDVKPAAGAKINKTSSESAATKNLPSGVKAASRQNSTVASLQQKFENKTNMNTNNVKLSLKSKA